MEFFSIFSESELTFTFTIIMSSVRLSSVTFVQPTQAIEIFGHISTPCCTFWPSMTFVYKFYGDRPRGTPP